MLDRPCVAQAVEALLDGEAEATWTGKLLKLYRYQRADGSEPFTDWLNGVRDKATQARIRVRLQRLAAGNVGDVKPVGGGVCELRIHFGAGDRVYFAEQGATWVLLLCGGDKSSQRKDSAQAQAFLEDWKARQQ